MKNIFKEFIYKEISEVYTSKKYKFLKNKEILITGATGLLGHYFIAFFLKACEGGIDLKKLLLFIKTKFQIILIF